MAALQALILAASMAAAGLATAQEYQGKEGHLFACIRDGIRTYTANPLPTDSACRQLNYRWIESATKRPSDPPGTFMGYRCATDCSGHRAVYAWAARQGVSAASNCTGNSQSFVEGCMAYVDAMTRGEKR